MLKSFLGTKSKQSQLFTENGNRIPVTYINAGPCWVTQIMQDKSTIQLGFGSKKHINKAQTGILKKAGINEKPRFFRIVENANAEVKADSENSEKSLKVGDVVVVSDVFKAGDNIRVQGQSKGKGFASAIKRHGFHGGPRTHGQSDRERAPGSLGSGTTPGRVFKGKKMAGRMGQDTVTVVGLEVIEVKAEENILVVKGLVPGAKGSLVIVEKE